VATSEAACAYSTERLFNDRVKVHQDWTVPYERISVPVTRFKRRQGYAPEELDVQEQD
jgi:hypothetical protein